MTLILVFVAHISYYHPGLCNVAPVNCYDQSAPFRMAGGHDARRWYGRAAACPLEFYGARLTIVGLPSSAWHGEWRCLDTGGAVVTTSDGFVVDLLLAHPIVTGPRPARVTVNGARAAELAWGRRQ